jgi:hypothetical protein
MNPDIITIIVALIGSATTGAVITAIITSRRNRVQPIGTNVNISGSIIPENLVDGHVTKITISGSTESYHYDTLYLVSVELLNKGNTDFEEFQFGITLPENTSIINIKANGLDRHHQVESKPDVGFNSDTNEMDFILKPFNRRDKYKVMLTLSGHLNEYEEVVKFSTTHPVKFVEIESVATTTMEVLFKVLTKSYPFN